MIRNWKASSKRRAMTYAFLAVIAIVGLKPILGDTSLPKEESQSQSEGPQRGNPASDGKGNPTNETWWTKRSPPKDEAEYAESGEVPLRRNDPASDDKDDPTNETWWTRRSPLEDQVKYAEFLDEVEQVYEIGEEIAEPRKPRDTDRVDSVETEQEL